MHVVVEEDGFGPVHGRVQLGIGVKVLAVQVYPAGVGAAESRGNVGLWVRPRSCAPLVFR